MQDQLFSQCRETIQTKMVRALQRAGLTRMSGSKADNPVAHPFVAIGATVAGSKWTLGRTTTTHTVVMQHQLIA
jgi:hypothetical protein